MKMKKRNIIWAVVFNWVISTIVTCGLFPGNMKIIIVMCCSGIIPIFLFVRFYTSDEGKKDIKEAKKEYEYERLVKECKKLDRKCYRRHCMESQNDDDFLPM